MNTAATTTQTLKGVAMFTTTVTPIGEVGTFGEAACTGEQVDRSFVVFP